MQEGPSPKDFPRLNTLGGPNLGRRPVGARECIRGRGSLGSPLVPPHFWTAKAEGVPPGRRELPWRRAGHRAKSEDLWPGPFILLRVGEEGCEAPRGGTQGERGWREARKSSGMRGPRTPRGRAPRCCLPIVPRPSRSRRAARRFPDGAAGRAGRGGSCSGWRPAQLGQVQQLRSQPRKLRCSLQTLAHTVQTLRPPQVTSTACPGRRG